MTTRMRWVLVVLAGAEAIIILDIAFGSIVLDDVMTEFGTSVATLQAVLTAYALVVAALTLVGGRLAVRYGNRTMFRVGLAIRAAGAVVTACAFNLVTYGLGEAVLAGIGMALVAPSSSSMTGTLFKGTDRSRAFAAVGMAIAVAGGVGPMLGGWITTNLSWRWCNWFEFAVTAALLAGSFMIPAITRVLERSRFDWAGFLASAASFTAIVMGLERANEWGWWASMASPIEPFGLSLTPFLVAIGIAMMFVFAAIERRRGRAGLPVLLDLELLRDRGLRASLVTTMATQGALAGLLFAIPVYLQIVDGHSAFESGLYLLPMAVTAFLASAIWPRLAARFTADRLGMVAGACMVLCAVLAYWDVEPALVGSTLLVGIGVFGIGSGIMDSQLDAVTLSTVPDERASEAAGLQATSDNFGSAIGIALVGTVLIIALTTGMRNYIDSHPELSPSIRAAVTSQLDSGLPMVDVEEARAFAASVDLDPTNTRDVTDVVNAYKDQQRNALESALIACGALGAITIAASSRLPRRRFTDVDDGSEVATTS